jgi:polyhydroxyalkanoate synthesis repressor PhaR
MVTIKRYPNRKLYNTEAKQYIKLEGIANLIREGAEIQVIDHASGEDLTALTLTQIILEQEKKQSGLLSNTFLTNLIRTSEDRLSALQRTLFSPGTFFKQMDEEIQKRIQALVKRGEMTEREGKSLLEKLMKQGKLFQDSQPSGRELEAIQHALSQRDIPTQDDLQSLNDKLEELTRRLDELNPTDD